MCWVAIIILLICALVELMIISYLLFGCRNIPNSFDFECRCKIEYLGKEDEELKQNQEYVVDVCRDDTNDSMIQCRVWIKDDRDRYYDILLFYPDYSSFRANWNFTIKFDELKKWGST